MNTTSSATMKKPASSAESRLPIKAISPSEMSVSTIQILRAVYMPRTYEAALGLTSGES
jgi:hypothetical protein